MISIQRLHRRGRTYAFKDFCSIVLTCLVKGLQSHFHECLLLPLGYCQLCSPNFRHHGPSLRTAGGSKVCMKFTRTEVKYCPCKPEHGCHKPGIQRQPKPFWKRQSLGRSCRVQTDMNFSMFGQEFQPSEGTVSKGYSNYVPCS